MYRVLEGGPEPWGGMGEIGVEQSPQRRLKAS
jgi:hypothetical protein